ncbi:3-hydroxyacyl-ACP dehydratase FabZ [Buchnera aphidicola]|uniref:3-hydroxyacyl-[acyl-carrier-protein] dehydratase FabZ n=1 Tax=Buchnera aphidicola subsp. Melaphis rhois TaxID=118103 RepID=A0A4D6Y0W3_BUCMH|nr:3-hydroxyacyl-ACP dehydratase FabZ [Buchnera aphidicola]QCI23252.1 3-hydroxyacyl-[acyl-carrier-protein] dehydratase FabZ [Buchnera aphidicola (Melaphis rhois)]
MCKLELQDILKLLPHRYPFVFVDKVIDYKEKKYIIAIKHIQLNEFFLQGHFPNYPIFPGVLILESMLQAACILAYKSINILRKKKLFYFSSIDYARFKKKIFPGDKMIINVNIITIRKNIIRFQGNISVNGITACNAKMSFMNDT